MEHDSQQTQSTLRRDRGDEKAAFIHKCNKMHLFTHSQLINWALYYHPAEHPTTPTYEIHTLFASSRRILSCCACDGSSPILVCRVASHVVLFTIPLLAAGTARFPVTLVAEVITVVAGVKEGDATGREPGDARPAEATAGARAHGGAARWRLVIASLDHLTHLEDHHNLGEGRLLSSGLGHHAIA